jgi:hypothetical protein
VFVSLSVLCTYKIARLQGSTARKFGWFLASALGIALLTGIPRGVIYLVVGPLALALYPSRSDDA